MTNPNAAEEAGGEDRRRHEPLWFDRWLARGGTCESGRHLARARRPVRSRGFKATARTGLSRGPRASGPAWSGLIYLQLHRIRPGLPADQDHIGRMTWSKTGVVSVWGVNLHGFVSSLMQDVKFCSSVSKSDDHDSLC